MKNILIAYATHNAYIHMDEVDVIVMEDHMYVLFTRHQVDQLLEVM